MPGQKSVKWDDTNRAKVFDALTAMKQIKLSIEEQETIAAYVGSGCTSKAIDTLFTTLGLRKKTQIHDAIAITHPDLAETVLKARSEGTRGRPPTGQAKRKSPDASAETSAAKKVALTPITKKLTARRKQQLAPATPPQSGSEELDSKTIKSKPRIPQRKKSASTNYQAQAGLAEDEDDEAVEHGFGGSDPHSSDIADNVKLEDTLDF